jgi:hypothetical protein
MAPRICRAGKLGVTLTEPFNDGTCCAVTNQKHPNDLARYFEPTAFENKVRDDQKQDEAFKESLIQL